MTLDEAIRDKNRPLSVAPAEWMEYQKAKDVDEEVLYDEEAARMVAEERVVSDTESSAASEDYDEAKTLTAYDRLEIGIEQMAIGCKMAIRALQELSRTEAGQTDRSRYDAIGNYIRNGVSPYLADTMRACRR